VIDVNKPPSKPAEPAKLESLDMRRKNCPGNQYVEDGQCVQKCSEGRYVDEEDMVCRRCAKKCKKCKENNSKCLSCDKNYVLMNGDCIALTVDFLIGAI